MNAPDCPDADRIHACLLGTLPPAEMEAVEAHIDACPRCEELAAKLDAAGDSLVVGLRRVSPDLPASPILSPSARPSHVSGTRPPVEMMGAYRLLRLLGRGGMGAVYRAQHTVLNRMVAIKVLAKQRLDDPAAVARFRREVRAGGKLAHPNIVRAADAGEAGGTPYLVMDLVEGVDLGRLVRRLGRPSVADACELIRQAALGLQHAHEKGLIHRDIKPSNLMLGRTWGEDGPPGVKVLDLGLVYRPEDGAMTHSDALLGTRDYIAPEQWADTHNVDGRTDLYSLGCTLFHLLAGRPPYAGREYDSLLAKREAHVEGAVPSVRECRPEVPETLDQFLRRMLAKKPADRPQSAAEAALALAPFAAGADLTALWQAALEHPDADRDSEGAAIRQTGKAGDGSTALAAIPLTTRVPRRRRSSQFWWIGVAALMAVALVVGIWFGRATERMRMLGEHDDTRALAFSPDGKWAVTGGDAGTLRIWDLASHTERVTLVVPPDPADSRAVRPSVLSVVVAPDGHIVAAAGNALTVCDPAGERFERLPLGWPASVVATAANGSAVFAGGGTADRWELVRFEWKHHDEDGRDGGPGGPVTALGASADGSFAVAGLADGRVLRWHPGRRAIPLEGTPGGAVVGVHVAPDGRIVACSSERAAVWAMMDGTPIRSFSLTGGKACHTALTPDGRHLLAANTDGPICCYATEDGRLELSLSPHDTPAAGVAWSGDGKHALSAGRDRRVYFWNLPLAPSRSPNP